MKQHAQALDPDARYDAVVEALLRVPPHDTWWRRLDAAVVAVTPHETDPARSTLRALDLAGAPPAQIRNAVAELRARLEEMG